MHPGEAQKKLKEKKPAWQGIPPVPDRVFIQRLKRFDPDLSVEFDRTMGKFVIYQEGRISGRSVAMVVQGDENESGFRYPDQRDLETLSMVDMHNDRVRRMLLHDREQQMLDIREKDQRNAHATLREAGIDDRHYMQRTLRRALNDGKAAPHVRQVTPRPRGKVFG